MSRAHFSAPAKSNALTMPVPVITHTVRPSVTGDGVDMFCLRPARLPEPSGFFQMTACLVRSTAHSSRSPVKSAVATLRKMVLPQIIGVDPLREGIGSFHAMFSVGDQVRASPVSLPTPLSSGPRHCGQLSAARSAALETSKKRAAAETVRCMSIPATLDADDQNLVLVTSCGPCIQVPY